MDELENIGGVIVKQQVRTFVITEVDYETDEHDQDELDLPQQMAVTAKELGIEEDDDSEYIQHHLVNWISETTGLLVNGYSYYEVRPDGTKIDMDGNILKSSRKEIKQIQRFVESRLPVNIIGAEMGGKHVRLTVRNNNTGTTRLVFVSATPSKSGRYNLVVRDIRRTFREVGEDL